VSALSTHAQRPTSATLTEQMLVLDSQIDQEVQELVNLLSSVGDSVDSSTKVARLKTDAMEGLKKSLDIYQRERQKRLGELQQNYANLSREDLAKQIDNMDSKINERIDQIMKISQSFTVDGGVDKYTHELRNSGRGRRNNVDVRQVKNPEYTKNQRTGNRGDQNRGKVIEGLEKHNKSLEAETAQLERNLSASRAANRPELEDRIEKNRDLIAENQSNISEMKNIHASGQVKEVSRNDAQNLKKKIDDTTLSLRSKHQELIRLKAERDRLLAMEKTRNRTR